MVAIEGRITCPGCQLALPVRVAQLGEEAALWQCARCNRPEVGVVIPSLMQDFADHILLGACYFDLPSTAGIRYEMWQATFRHAQALHRVPANEARRARRMARIAAVEAIELNRDLQPVGQPFSVMLSDISPSGVGLINTHSLVEPFVAIRLPPVRENQIQVIAELKHQDLLRNGFYSIGGKLVHRLGSVRLV